MTEENSSETVPSVVSPPPKPVSNDPPRVVKEAEHKLKEMSRKAKERQHEATRRNTAQNKLSEISYFWLVIGGLGALGVGYLVFGGKEETKPRPRFKFVPKPKTPEKPREQVNDSGTERNEEKSSPKFELNCF